MRVCGHAEGGLACEEEVNGYVGGGETEGRELCSVFNYVALEIKTRGIFCGLVFFKKKSFKFLNFIFI